MSDDEDGLWNELSHQQSREMEQHRARTMQASPYTSIEAMKHGFRRATEEVQIWAAQVSDVASQKWHAHQQNQRRRQQHQRQQGRSSRRVATATTATDAYLNEFGIYSTTEDGERPLLSEQESEYTSFGEGQDDEFIHLPRLRFRPRAEGWGAVSNLDLYFNALYTYYYNRGWIPLVAKGAVELITLVFTYGLSVFLFAYVDWSRLSSCIDEATCLANFSDYIIKEPFAQGTLWSFLLFLYCVVLSAYAVFAFWSFGHTVTDAWQSKWVFEERLGISSRKLEGGAVDWDKDVVTKLMELQRSGSYRVAIHGQDFDALTVAQRILRKENFLVALFNRGLLDLSVPFIGNDYFCSSLEWCLFFSIMNFMFNHKYEIRPAFYLDHVSLKRRLMLCGIAHALFMPYLLFFSTLHFGLRNAYDWKSTKNYLGPREWSLAAKWIFREFNELQHNFERRMAPSYEATESYLKLFGQNEIIVALGRVLVFIGGSLGAVLIAFTAINDAILLHVKIADWNLLWYAGVVGVMFSAGKAMIPNGEVRQRYTRNMFAEMDDALANVTTHTHHYPDTWKGRGHDQATYKAVSGMFKYKAQLFFKELLSMVLAPYILCVSLARCAEPICEFVLAVRAEVPGAGDVCGYATFDFDKYGDETWEGRTLGSTIEPLAGTLTESVLRIGNVNEATKRFPVPKARYGKMEKSFFSFKAAHPNWKCSESGQNLVDKIEEYRREETAALTREQQLHIEAAARQLETLARLERFRIDQQREVEIVNEHIPKSQAPADAGAGIVATTQSHSTSPDPPENIRPSGSPQQQDPLQMSRGDELDPPFALRATLPLRPILASDLTPIPNSTSHTGLSLGLSSELRRILNMSTLDPDVSVSGSLLHGAAPNEDDDRRAERHYLWLERYRAHMAAQQAQLDQTAMSEPRAVSSVRRDLSHGQHSSSIL